MIAIAACGKSAERSEPTRSEPIARRADPPAPTCKSGDNVCVGDDVVVCENGQPGHKLTSCRGGCKAGACIDTCGANDVELIYVVENDRTLLAFDPRKLPNDPFRRIGTLACSDTTTPFSMAVDRTGLAWVLYSSGAVHRVSIHDARCLEKAARPEGAPRAFGMGFVTDGPKETTEKLFVVAADDENPRLATIDTAVFPTRWTNIGKIDAENARSPELSGTSEGKLYGYFPGNPGRGFVSEIARTGKLTGKRWPLPGDEGTVNAWAFAFWGDVFYVFLTLDGVNEVHAISRKTGKHDTVVAKGAHRIVGAGVSTCAPLLEKPL